MPHVLLCVCVCVRFCIPGPNSYGRIRPYLPVSNDLIHILYCVSVPWMDMSLILALSAVHRAFIQPSSFIWAPTGVGSCSYYLIACDCAGSILIASVCRASAAPLSLLSFTADNWLSRHSNTHTQSNTHRSLSCLVFFKKTKQLVCSDVNRIWTKNTRRCLLFMWNHYAHNLSLTSFQTSQRPSTSLSTLARICLTFFYSSEKWPKETLERC